MNDNLRELKEYTLHRYIHIISTKGRNIIHIKCNIVKKFDAYQALSHSP